jgi:calcineurin-like phosphoesterase family protein
MIDLTNKKLYVISDCHFYHKNIIKYCNRPFSTVDEMNKTIFDNWNNIVDDDDIVLNLGDFVIGIPSKNEVSQFLDNSLKGKILYLIGNHDRFTEEMFGDRLIKDKVFYFKYNNFTFACSHYPPNKELFEDADFILYGHVHNNVTDSIDNTYNCCVEVNDYKPIFIEDIIEKLIS